MMQDSIIINKDKTKTRIPKDVKTPFRVSALISLVLIILSIGAYGFIQPEIPLFYSLPKSSSQIVDKIYIFLIPIMSLIITATHFSILIASKEMEKRLKMMFAWATVILQFISLLIFLRIIIIIV